MVHAQIIVPPELSDEVLGLLIGDETVTNVVRFPAAAHRPAGDVILADIAREEASAVVRGLERLGIAETGAISLSETTVERSRGGEVAAIAARGVENDAVLWEEVEERTSASAELSGVFLGLLVVAVMIAALALLTESEILMVGAMVVGPEFGPLAGIVVGVVAGARALARRSLVSLAIGIPIASLAATVMVLGLRLFGLAPDTYEHATGVLGALVSTPDWSVLLVAALAGVAGILALTTAHAGALVGVLISVATVPSMAGMGVGLAYGDVQAVLEAAVQLTANIAGILVAGLATLGWQRAFFARRVRRRRRAAASMD